MCGPTPPAETETACVTFGDSGCRCPEESDPPLRLALADDDGCTVVMRGSRVLGMGPKAMAIAMEVGPEWTAHVARVQREYMQRLA